MKLSKRLSLIAESVHDVKVMADIGTDHGALPIALVKSGRCQRAIASDINKGPVDIATKRVGLARMNERIEIRKGDGLKVLKAGEAELVVIAGMGGLLITTILEASLEVVRREDVKLILQPNTEPGLVRTWLLEHGFCITEEELVFDQGKFYEIIWTSFRDENEAGTDKTQGSYPGDFGGIIGGLVYGRKHPVAVPYLKKKLVEAEDVYSYLLLEEGRTDLENKDNVLARKIEMEERIVQIKKLIKELN